MSNTPDAGKPTKIFFSYAHQDEQLRDRLEKHLRVLRDKKIIESWHYRQISAGTEWEKQIDENLNTANIILLLVSSDFLGSNYCYDIEMKRAMQRHASGEALVIPIILRSCEWKEAPFGKLEPLPPGGKPVTSWKNKDAAFAAIVQGIKRGIRGEGLAKPVQPNKRQKFLKWAIEERHWPLLLSFIIPLYLLSLIIPLHFMIDSGLHERTLFILGGIASFIIGILYWAIRRQSKRLWPSGFLGIVGAGLTVYALTLPICSPVKEVSNKSPLSVTVARFRPDGSTPRSYARNFNETFMNELKKTPITINTYNAEVEDEEQEKIDAQVESFTSCNCNVFVSAVVRRSDDKKKGEELADFNLRMRNIQARSDTQESAELKTIEPKNIIVKDQKSNSIVNLLVAYAYYKLGEWGKAIEILGQIREAEKGRLGAEKGRLRAETYFYEGLCRLNDGMQTLNVQQLKDACNSFRNASPSDKESYSDEESVSLNFESQFNLAYTQIILSKYLQEDQAMKEVESAIEGLENLSKLWGENKNVLGTIGDYDPTSVNLVLAYSRMYEIAIRKHKKDDGNKWLEKAKDIIAASKTSPEARARSQINIAQLLTNAGLRSNNRDEFEKWFGQAIDEYIKAREYFESRKDRYLQKWVTVSNNYANILVVLGTYLGSEADLKHAKELFEEVLQYLSKDKYHEPNKYLEDWALTKSNLAYALIELGKLNKTDGKDFDDANKLCQEVIDAYSQSQQDQIWVSARRCQATALCLLGSRPGDTKLQFLEDSLTACKEVSAKATKGSRNWALNEKTWGDAYFQLNNLREAQIRYQNAELLCDIIDITLEKVCDEINQKIN